MTFDDLSTMLSDHLDAAVIENGDTTIRVLPTSVAPHKREFQVCNRERACLVSITLSDVDGGLHLGLKQGANWLRSVAIGKRDPAAVIREAGGGVLAMLKRQARDAA